MGKCDDTTNFAFARLLKNRRLWIVSAIIAFFFSGFIVIGRCLMKHNELDSLTSGDFLLLIFLMGIFTCCVAFLFLGIEKISLQPKSESRASVRTIFLLSSLILFLSWIPSWFAAWPGVFSYDAPHQLGQFVTGQIANNQPVVSSFFLYCFMSLGKTLFGSWEGALAFYICLQMIFGSLTFGYACSRIYYVSGKKWILVLSLVLFCFYPCNQLFIVNATKDIPYAFFTLWIIMLITEAAIDPEAFFRGEKRRRNYLALFLFISLFLFYRSNSVYVILLASLFLILCFRKPYRRRLFLVILSSVLLYFIVTGPVFSNLHIGKQSSIMDILALPSQQVTDTYIRHGEEFTPDEQYDIRRFFSIEDNSMKEFAGRYRPTDADNIKTSLNVNNLSGKGFTDFLRFWAKLGVEHPRTYLSAALNNTRGYWYPFHTFTREGSDIYIEYTNSTYKTGIMIKREPILPEIASIYQWIGEKNGLSVTAIGWLCSIAASLWGLILILGYTVFRHVRELAPAMIILWILTLTILAGPLSLMRYMYPVTVCLPYLFSILIRKKD